MTGTGRVTRADIEAKLGELQGAVSRQTDGTRARATPVLIGGVILVILLAYLLGRRRGRKKTTVVEIRRV
jgi:hypothetical protein